MNCRILFIAAVLLLLGVGAGCKGSNEQATSPAADRQPATVQPEASPAGPGEEETAPATSEPAHGEPAPQVAQISGKVLETMNAAGYTYVNVETPSGPVWAALPETRVEAGKDIVLAGGMEMKNFESKTLGRTFDSLIFSSGIVPQGVQAAAPTAPAQGGDSFAAAMQQEAASVSAKPMLGGNAPVSGGSVAAIVPPSDIKVDKAGGENAYTIGELFAKKDELNGKKVKVRGKVVKVSLKIMGKNWLHLQDGTGDAGSKTHDLVVTTSAEAQKDAVVVVEGTLHADRDFGSGYRYEVIVEDAEVK
ncbi:MAG TPA: DNA-binding protein [Desulfobulbaceae bacterium]|nr:DNA-binding protein [Desulfobulbaceae bacterium]